MRLESFLSEFLLGATRSILEFNAFATPFVGIAQADHVCYTCRDVTEYETLRAKLLQESRFDYTAWISGRRISIFRLNHGLPTALGVVTVLELSDQKPDASQKSGFNHIEIYPASGVAHGTSKLEMLARDLGYDLTVNAKAHHVTHDLRLASGFRVRIEAEPLVESIVREMRHV